MPIRGARLRVTPGGFRYVSPVLSLDLSRYGIVLTDVEPLAPRVHLQLLQIFETVAAGLGFAVSETDAPHQLPRPGEAIAVHCRVLEIDRANEMALQTASEEQDAVGPNDPGSVASAQEDPAADEDGEDPGFNM